MSLIRFPSPLVVAVVLAVLTATAYASVVRCDFLSFDDRDYVVDNLHVRAGPCGASLAWACASFECANWHPLTWISLEIDAALYHLDPAGFHATNLALHIANVLLLFSLLQRLTGAVGRSAFVAAAFGLHPLHVESVAWVAERKDVLSTLSWLLTILAYARYARRPGAGRYSLVIVCFALGLAAKPMLVTLPFVLLLLDFWPLRRWPHEGEAHEGEKGMRGKGEEGKRRGRSPSSTTHHSPLTSHHIPGFQTATWWRLAIEKIPLFALSAASSVVTVIAQQRGGAVEPIDTLPVSWRILNALVAYVWYLGKTVLPVDLAAFYPHPRTQIALWQAAAAAVLLLIVSGLTLRFAWRAPYLLVGWCWYLGTLVPVIGLVQVGEQATADRYSYVPLIGLFVALSWGGYELARRWSPSDWWPSVGAALLLAAWGVMTWNQVAHWRDDRSLWEHALAATSGNYQAHAILADWWMQHGDAGAAREHALRCGELRADARAQIVLGNLCLKEGRIDEAENHFRQAVELRPDRAECYNNLGTVLAMRGRFEPAAQLYRQAVALKPANAMAHHNLGLALLNLGAADEATRCLQSALRIDSGFTEAYDHLGDALFQRREWSPAVSAYAQAVDRDGKRALYRCDLASALWELGDREEAGRQYQVATQLDPGWVPRAAERAWRLATDENPDRRRPYQALKLAKQVCQASHPAPARLLDVLAAAYAVVGDFEAATNTARRALDAAEKAGEAELVDSIGRRLSLYEGQLPYHQESRKLKN